VNGQIQKGTIIGSNPHTLQPKNRGYQTFFHENLKFEEECLVSPTY
jgi:hypothetical protein